MRRCPGIQDLGFCWGLMLVPSSPNFSLCCSSFVFRLSRLRIDVAVKETVWRAWCFTAKMAQSNWQKLKNRWNAETKDEEKLAAHLRLLRAVGLFAGSVFLMRNFGDLMAI